MKKLLLISLVTYIGLINAQNVIPFGQRIPEYYYWDTNWYDWLYIQNPDSAFDYYPYTNALTVYLRPYADIFVGRKCVTNTPLKIIGIAAPVTTGPANINFVYDTIEEHRIPEQFKLYIETDSGFECLTEAQWDTTSRYKMCFRNGYNTDIYTVREAYFEQPYILSGTFYVGGTTHNTLKNFPFGELPYDYLHIPTFYVGYQPEDTTSGAVGDDVIWKYIDERIMLNLPQWYLDYLGDAAYYDTVKWNREQNNVFLAFFPIFDTSYVYIEPVDSCNAPTGFRILNNDSTGVTLTWDAANESLWEVAVYPHNSPIEDGFLTQSDLNFITFDELDTSMCYTAYVRTLCNDTLFSPWSDSLQFCVAGRPTTDPTDPVSILNIADDYTFLMPNPARSHVSIFSSFKIKNIEIFTSQGTLLYNSNVDGLTKTIDVSSLAKGVYVVRIATATGYVIRRLIVH